MHQKTDIHSIEEHDHGHDGDCCHHSEQPHVRNNAKIGRNDPCFCGSGKKYKKCCLSEGENNPI